MAWISIQKAKTVRFFIKILQNALFRSVAALFGQIAFLSVKVLKMVKLASNSLQNGKTVRFSLKLFKTLFSGHAEHVLAKSHFWASTFSKSSSWPQMLLKTGKQCAFYENCTKRCFQVMRSTFWPNRIFERQRSQNGETGLKFSSKRENSALFIKIVQNAVFRPCVQAMRFGQITFLSVIVLKIVKLGSNILANGKTVRFPWKLYKTLFSWKAHCFSVFKRIDLLVNRTPLGNVCNVTIFNRFFIAVCYFDLFRPVFRFDLFPPVRLFDWFSLVCHFDLFRPVCQFDSFRLVCHFDIFWPLCHLCGPVWYFNSTGLISQFDSFIPIHLFDSFEQFCHFDLFAPVSYYDFFAPVCHLDPFGPVNHSDLFGPVVQFDSFGLCGLAEIRLLWQKHTVSNSLVQNKAILTYKHSFEQLLLKKTHFGPKREF